MRNAETKWSFLVFAAAAGLVWWTAGSRFVLGNNDEGIYLACAMRMLRGEVPYRDFFYYLPPATPAILTGALAVFGEKLWAARIPLAIDAGILTACAFWLTARLANMRAAAAVGFCFLAFETAEHDRLVVDHRWDSSAFATLAVVLTISLLDAGVDPSSDANRGARWRAIGAGFFAALAVWATTPLALAAAVLLGAAMVIPRLRAALPGMLAGAGACSAGFFAWLAAKHDVAAFWSGIAWPATHYAGANRTPYGWVIGGYANLFHGVAGGEVVVVAIFLVFLTLPATLPIFAVIGWPLRLRRHPKDEPEAILLLLASMLALVASTLPRPDLIHLMYVSPVAYALTAGLLYRVVPARVAIAIAFAAVFMASVEDWMSVARWWSEPAMETRVGKVRGSEGDLRALRLVLDHVRPQDSLFAFPYWPNFYFASGARNPTRYAYLQPGMFSSEEEHAALEELEKDPPRWVLYVDTPAETFLRIWPGSDPARLRFPSIERFIATRYRTVETAGAFDLKEAR